MVFVHHRKICTRRYLQIYEKWQTVVWDWCIARKIKTTEVAVKKKKTIAEYGEDFLLKTGKLKNVAEDTLVKVLVEDDDDKMVRVNAYFYLKHPKFRVVLNDNNARRVQKFIDNINPPLREIITEAQKMWDRNAAVIRASIRS